MSYYHLPHFTDEGMKTEKISALPQMAQPASGRAGALPGPQCGTAEHSFFLFITHLHFIWFCPATERWV